MTNTKDYDEFLDEQFISSKDFRNAYLEAMRKEIQHLLEQNFTLKASLEQLLKHTKSLADTPDEPASQE